MIYEKIKKWPIHHERNVLITYFYFKFGLKKTCEKYNLSRNRINGIYRTLLCRLWEQKSGIPWIEAVHDRKLCRSKDRIDMVKDYYLSIFNRNIEDLYEGENTI